MSDFFQHSAKNEAEKPDYFKGLLWSLFSFTAMVSAFLIPIHVALLALGYEMNLDSLFARFYFLFLFAALLYSSFYRVKTVFYDLTWVRISKVVGVFLMGLFVVLMIFLGLRLFVF